MKYLCNVCKSKRIRIDYDDVVDFNNGSYDFIGREYHVFCKECESIGEGDTEEQAILNMSKYND